MPNSLVVKFEKIYPGYTCSHKITSEYICSIYDANSLCYVSNMDLYKNVECDKLLKQVPP